MALSLKDPNEKVIVTFDFTSVPSPISAPTISIKERGDDIELSGTMISGLPQVQTNKVLQLVQGGEDGKSYVIRCEVDVSLTGERFVAKDILTVKY